MSLKPREFAFLDRKYARKIGLPLRELGDPPRVGMLFCDDEDGRHWTAVTGDAEYVEGLRGAPEHVLRGLTIPAGKFPLKRAGWPDEWVGPGLWDDLPL